MQRKTGMPVAEVEGAVRVLPIQAIGRNVLLSGAFSLVPVFAALLWLTSASEHWPVVALAEIVVAAFVLTIYLRFRMVEAVVTDDGFVKHTIKPRAVRASRADIARVVVTRVYRNHSHESMLHLLGIGADDRALFRLSGLWWSEAAILEVADALDATGAPEDVPVSKSEYLELVPAARTWYQRRVVTGVAVVVIALAVAAVVFVLQGLSMRA